MSYSISTSNHNYDEWQELFEQLCLILFLHQTTTETIVCADNDSCVLFYFYIKPQPYSGRGYNNNNLKIYKVNTQCVYRTSTVAEDVSTSEMGYGVIYTANNNKRNADTTTIKTVDDGTKSAKTLSYGATSRYAIRPIYIAE